jgi:hypothetical protein
VDGIPSSVAVNIQTPELLQRYADYVDIGYHLANSFHPSHLSLSRLMNIPGTRSSRIR